MGFWSLLISLTYSWSLFGSVHDVNILNVYIYIYYQNIYVYIYIHTYYTYIIHSIFTRYLQYSLQVDWQVSLHPSPPNWLRCIIAPSNGSPKLWLSPQAVKNHRTKGKTAWKAAGSKRRDGPVEWKIVENHGKSTVQRVFSWQHYR